MATPLPFLDLARSRRTARDHAPAAVPAAAIAYVLEAARWAPSAANRQPWEFIVIGDPELKRALRLAFLGCGFITGVHSAHLRALGGLIVPSYASRDRRYGGAVPNFLESPEGGYAPESLPDLLAPLAGGRALGADPPEMAPRAAGGRAAIGRVSLQSADRVSPRLTPAACELGL